MGSSCETNFNECGSNPCQNGATCQDGINKYTCDCLPGYTGGNCQTNVNECGSNPCQNGATCQDGIDAFTCDCLPGFYGEYCEVNLNECASNPCQNEGFCLDEINAYTCMCSELFGGDNCEVFVGPACTLSPCRNGGTCVNTADNGYWCECLFGFAGVDCQIDNTRPRGPCPLGGAGEPNCTCAADYRGTLRWLPASGTWAGQCEDRLGALVGRFQLNVTATGLNATETPEAQATVADALCTALPPGFGCGRVANVTLTREGPIVMVEYTVTVAVEASQPSLTAALAALQNATLTSVGLEGASVVASTWAVGTFACGGYDGGSV